MTDEKPPTDAPPPPAPPTANDNAGTPGESPPPTDYEALFYGLLEELRTRASVLPILAHLVDAAIEMTSKRPLRSLPLNLLLRSMKQAIAEVRDFQGDLLPPEDAESRYFYAKHKSPGTPSDPPV